MVFRERGGERREEGEGEREERNIIDRLPLACALTGEGTHSLGVCPDGNQPCPLPVFGATRSHLSRRPGWKSGLHLKGIESASIFRGTRGCGMEELTRALPERALRPESDFPPVLYDRRPRLIPGPVSARPNLSHPPAVTPLSQRPVDSLGACESLCVQNCKASAVPE